MVSYGVQTAKKKPQLHWKRLYRSLTHWPTALLTRKRCVNRMTLKRVSRLARTPVVMSALRRHLRSPNVSTVEHISVLIMPRFILNREHFINIAWWTFENNQVQHVIHLLRHLILCIVHSIQQRSWTPIVHAAEICYVARACPLTTRIMKKTSVL